MKISDNEIIEALEHCANNNDCEGCQFGATARLCIKYIPEYALKIIKKQKSEIEQLNNTLVHMDDFARSICDIRMSKGKAIANSEDLLTYIEDEKRKAIKEFAERLKEESSIECDVSMGFGRPCYEDAVPIIAIDNLVAEMVGEK